MPRHNSYEGDRHHPYSSDRGYERNGGSSWSSSRGGDRGRDDRFGGDRFGGDRFGGSTGGRGGRSFGGGREDYSSNRPAPASGAGGPRPTTDDEPYHREDQNEEELFKHHQNTGINFDKYDAIPVEVFGKDQPSPITSFEEGQLPKSLLQNILLAEYTKPTPVQKYSIPIVGMAKRDLMACAQTGSGKTGGFLFPIISRLLTDERKPSKSGPMASPSVLVMAPTRELATQIYDECRKFIYRTGLKSVVIYGGADPRYQARQLEYGCDILVATPGRLVDMYDRGRISLSNIMFLVLDEADRMLDMGFEPTIRYLVEKTGMPSSDERSTLLFSATFPKEIQKLATDFLNSNYLFLTVGRVGSTTENITQRFEFCHATEKFDLLVKHINDVQGLCLVFLARKMDADRLEQYLAERGIKAQAIHGDKTQRQREYALRAFKNGQISVLVATDVAARGLDIPDVNHVINYDLPENIDDYVHRIGRTGRAGNKGIATGFFTKDNDNIAKDLIKLLLGANQEVPQQLTEAAERKSSRYGRGGGRGYGRGGRSGGFGGRGGGGFGRGGGFRNGGRF